jgi:hypothetical protein
MINIKEVKEKNAGIDSTFKLAQHHTTRFRRNRLVACAIVSDKLYCASPDATSHKTVTLCKTNNENF